MNQVKMTKDNNPMNPNKDQMISRLRESKARSDKREYENGKTAGQRWAENGADWDELRSLSRHTWDELCEGSAADDWSSTIAWAVDSEADSAAADNFREFCGSDAMSEEFAHGFFEGATESFAEARSQV